MKTLELKCEIKTLIKKLPATSPKQQILSDRYFCYCMKRWKCFFFLRKFPIEELGCTTIVLVNTI